MNTIYHVVRVKIRPRPGEFSLQKGEIARVGFCKFARLPRRRSSRLTIVSLSIELTYIQVALTEIVTHYETLGWVREAMAKWGCKMCDPR